MLEIGQTKKIFDHSEAQALLPLIQTVTEKHKRQLLPIQERLNRMLSNDPRRKHLEMDFADVVSIKLVDYIDEFDPDWAR